MGGWCRCRFKRASAAPDAASPLPLTPAHTLQLSEADNIKVAVRVRPLFSHETEKGGTNVVQVNSNTTIKVG